jgi:hypothetical protein
VIERKSNERRKEEKLWYIFIFAYGQRG